MQNAQNEIMVFVIRQLQIPFHETAILTIYISPQKFGKQTCEHCFSLEVSRFCEFSKIEMQLKWIFLISWSMLKVQYSNSQNRITKKLISI